MFRHGSEPDLPAVATGSHADAIPFSGKYDGVVGVLGALEAINVLKRLATFKKVLRVFKTTGLVVTKDKRVEL